MKISPLGAQTISENDILSHLLDTRKGVRKKHNKKYHISFLLEEKNSEPKAFFDIFSECCLALSSLRKRFKSDSTLNEGVFFGENISDAFRAFEKISLKQTSPVFFLFLLMTSDENIFQPAYLNFSKSIGEFD